GLRHAIGDAVGKWMMEELRATRIPWRREGDPPGDGRDLRQATKAEGAESGNGQGSEGGTCRTCVQALCCWFWFPGWPCRQRLLLTSWLPRHRPKSDSSPGSPTAIGLRRSAISRRAACRC